MCHIKALIYTRQFDSEEDLIARIVKAVATIRQQSAIFECARHSVASSSVSAVYRDLGALLLNICPKLVQNVTFLQNTSVVVLDFQPRPTLMFRGLTRTHVRHTVARQ